jgi:hypothetical protein
MKEPSTLPLWFVSAALVFEAATMFFIKLSPLAWFAFGLGLFAFVVLYLHRRACVKMVQDFNRLAAERERWLATYDGSPE